MNCMATASDQKSALVRVTSNRLTWPLHSAGSVFKREGYQTAVNTPFRGTYVPMAHFSLDATVRYNRAAWFDYYPHELLGMNLPPTQDLQPE